MKQNLYDFRQFQEELAALDRKNHAPNTLAPVAETLTTEERLARAKVEFDELRKRYRLTVAHVIAFFPEEEGVAFLQGLIAEEEGRPRRRRKYSTSADQ